MIFTERGASSAISGERNETRIARRRIEGAGNERRELPPKCPATLPNSLRKYRSRSHEAVMFRTEPPQGSGDVPTCPGHHELGVGGSRRRSCDAFERDVVGRGDVQLLQTAMTPGAILRGMSACCNYGSVHLRFLRGEVVYGTALTIRRFAPLWALVQRAERKKCARQVATGAAVDREDPAASAVHDRGGVRAGRMSFS